MTPTRFAVILMVGVAVAWLVQGFWLWQADRGDVLRYDVRTMEYVTPMHVTSTSSAVVGRVSKVERKKGMRLRAVDVEDVPGDQAILVIFAPTDRAWVPALAVGQCVHAWNGAQPLSAGTPLRVASVVPAAPDKHAVYLLASSASDVSGKVLAAKELALSIVSCRAPLDDFV